MASMSLWQTTAVAPAATTASAAAAPPANTGAYGPNRVASSPTASAARPQAGPPARPRPGLGRPAQEHEAPVPERREVVDDLPGAGLEVRHHARQPGSGPVDEHDRVVARRRP